MALTPTDKSIIGYRSMALAKARKRGLPEQLCEDFAQFATMATYVEGRTQDLYRLLVDFMRQEFGRLDKHNGNSLRAWKIRNPIPMDHVEIIMNVEQRLPTKIRLTDVERKILYMTVGGFSQDELAALLKISQSRVSQALARIRRKIDGAD